MASIWTNGSEHYSYATTADLPEIVEMLSDPDVARWLWFTPNSAAFFEQFFIPLIETQHQELGAGEVPHLALFAVHNEEGRFLGQGAAVAIDGSPGGFEIGFQLRREAWGQRVGTRLAEFLCAYVVHRCNAYRIEGSCLEGNMGSRAILEKRGLNLEGARPAYRLRNGIRHTELLYGARTETLDTEAIRQVAEVVGLA